METIYEDDAMVGEMTRIACAVTGSRLLQIHRFSENDQRHADQLLDAFNPERGATIADVGCGVGALAELMKATRPDLNFVLINKSGEQLCMCPLDFWTINGVAEELPFEPGDIDAIMATYVLGHVDLPRFVSECQRIRAKHVYIYDLFKLHHGKPCRLATDLQYTERTMGEVIYAFVAGGFNSQTRRARYSYSTPKEIAALMPRADTLQNSVSAAIVFRA